MIGDIGSIRALIDEMSSVIDTHLDLYLIGGGAMMFMGSKEYTKDLDFVVSSAEEYHAAIRALESLGFTSDRPSCGMDKVNLSDTRIRGEYRIDLFDRIICGELQLSESMMTRSVKRYESGDVSLQVCSGEDVFLLKSVTEREGDVSDCNNLIRLSVNFDWSVFIGELKIQMSFGNPIWITYVMERLVRMNMEARHPQTFKEVSELENAFLTQWADNYEKSTVNRSG